MIQNNYVVVTSPSCKKNCCSSVFCDQCHALACICDKHFKVSYATVICDLRDCCFQEAGNKCKMLEIIKCY